jgi:hypothetical protein
MTENSHPISLMKIRLYPNVIRRAICGGLCLVSLSLPLAADVVGEPLSDSATHLPEGHAILPESLSPDGRIGVLAPDVDHLRDGVPQNKLVEASTGILLAVIDAETAFPGANHQTLAGVRWSQDGALLRWLVGGKWGPKAFVLLKLDAGKVQWQTNALKQAEQEILRRAREASPQAYAAATQHNAGNGPAYPDGFTISAEPTGNDEGPPALPMQVKVTLTANPKAIDSFPKNAELDAEMTATIDGNGNFTVDVFALTGNDSTTEAAPAAPPLEPALVLRNGTFSGRWEDPADFTFELDKDNPRMFTGSATLTEGRNKGYRVTFEGRMAMDNSLQVLRTDEYEGKRINQLAEAPRPQLVNGANLWKGHVLDGGAGATELSFELSIPVE